jgi:hypothetical protein
MGPVVPTSGTTVQLELGPPFKKIRFGELKPEVQQPLRIDTRVSIGGNGMDVASEWHHDRRKASLTTLFASVKNYVYVF